MARSLKIITLTPSKAQELLDTIDRSARVQRKLNTADVSQLANMIRAGKWELNSDAFLVVDGILQNGQHRAAACVESGIAIDVAILVREESTNCLKVIDTVDRGRPRSVAEQIALRHGITSARNVQGICASIYRYCSGIVTKHNKLTVHQCLEVLKYFSAEVNAVIPNHAIPGIYRTPILAAIAFSARKYPEVLTTFLGQYIDGDNLPKKSPVLALRNYALGRKGAGGGGGLAQENALIAFNAIQKHLRGETVSQLSPSVTAFNHFYSMNAPICKKILTACGEIQN